MTSSARYFGSLLSDIDGDEFRSHYWPDRVFAGHGDPSRLPGLFASPHLQSADALLATGPADVWAWWKTTRLELAPVSAEAAGKLYRIGTFTIQIRRAERSVDAIAEALEQVGKELHAPLNYALCNAYVSPAGAPTAMHFDPQDVFIVQVTGAKRWRLASNPSVAYPPYGYWGAPEIPGELRELCTAEFPRQMPSDAMTVDLRPGSVLFIPRGTWHDTETLQDSVALTLSYSVQSWADALLERLAAKLRREPSWRAPATGLGAPGLEGQAALANMAEQAASLFGPAGLARAGDLFRETGQAGLPPAPAPFRP